ncbi:MAG: YchF/TatD family DNA exonuclease [Treponema sp.]|nr:YchF/TatD family DNA exonuclease [Treponema sp.]
MQFFDTHAHIGLIYDDPIEQLRVIKHAKRENVTRIVSINNSLHDFAKVYPTLKPYSGVYHAVGVAPSEVVTKGSDYVRTIEEKLKLPNIVAVGETGLDYYKQFGKKEDQIELFITQLELAQKHNLPVIIHNREAGKDIYDILQHRIPSSGAILHCYSEDAAYAKQCLDMNVWFSFAGNLTYPKAHNLHDTVMFLQEANALDRILIETESPFMIPQKYNVPTPQEKKPRTKPRMLPAIAEFLASMLEKDIEEVADMLWKNSCKAFKLPEE